MILFDWQIDHFWAILDWQTDQQYKAAISEVLRTAFNRINSTTIYATIHASVFGWWILVSNHAVLI